MSQNTGVDPKAGGSAQNAGPQRKLSTKGESLYKVLTLEKGASAEEVKKKYRLVVPCHNYWLPVISPQSDFITLILPQSEGYAVGQDSSGGSRIV